MIRLIPTRGFSRDLPVAPLGDPVAPIGSTAIALLFLGVLVYAWTAWRQR